MNNLRDEINELTDKYITDMNNLLEVMKKAQLESQLLVPEFNKYHLEILNTFQKKGHSISCEDMSKLLMTDGKLDLAFNQLLNWKYLDRSYYFNILKAYRTSFTKKTAILLMLEEEELL